MKKLNNNNKIILIGIIAVFFMFILYHFHLSPFAQCVNAYVKSKEFAIKSKSDKDRYANEAKIYYCPRLLR